MFPSRLERRRVSAQEWRERWLFVALIGPNLLLFVVFTYWPLLYSGYLSLFDWNFIRPRKRWAGAENYVEVFTSSQFWIIFGNTIVFAVFSVGLTLVLGLALAMLLNLPLRGRLFARGLIFSPYILSGAAIAVVWAYIFDPRYGLINELLGLIGLRSPDWLGSSTWAMPAVIIVYVWKNLGYAVVIYIAGLQAIPRELYEAARVDGAGPWARFWHVTLPGLGPIAFFLSVISILNCFQAFDIIRVLTNGGPANATNTLMFYLYELGFVIYDAGQAGVVAMVLFGFMMLLTLLQIYYFERRVHYSAGIE
jgi:multiple sugar transport system permease protein/sn-glycerol 3-phosphate transport system permease protein